jgi:hypothetical protein
VGTEELRCDTFSHERMYVDAHGRLSMCCQLSEYGDNEADVVADLRKETLHDVWGRYTTRMAELERASAELRQAGGEFDAFPCIRCARVLGKMEWIRQYPASPWAGAAETGVRLAPARPLVALSYARRSLQAA